MNALRPNWILEEISAFERSLALRTAIEMGIFTHIGRGLNTARALAEVVEASERGVSSLCDYLTVQEHLQKRGRRYVLTLNSRIYLSEDSPAYFGSAARFMASDEYVRALCELRSTVRRGRARSPGENWVSYAQCMAPLAADVADFVGQSFGRGDRPIQILDVAAGHGLYGIAVGMRNSQSHVYACDSTPVLRIARRNARKAGLTSRYHLLPGDLRRTNLAGPYDLIIAANVAHHLTEQENVQLFRKCYTALKQSGQVVLIDFVVHPDRVEPKLDAAFAFHLFATGSQEVYTFKQYRKILKTAGFQKVALNKGRFGHWMITASR